VSLWDGMVYTLLSSPAIKDAPYNFSFDSFVIAKTASSYQDWQLEHVIENIN
jgi:hypothetical protein